MSIQREDALRNISYSRAKPVPVIRFVRAFSQGKFAEPFSEGVIPNPIYTNPVTSRDKSKKWKLLNSKMGWSILKIFNKVGVGAGLGGPTTGSPRL